MRTPWLRAYSTLRSCSTPAPEAAISSISSNETTGELAGVGDDPRVGAEHAGDVGVDLADLGADGGGERDRGRVRAAAAERRDVLGGRDALEAGDEHDAVLVERVADAVGAHVEDARLGVGRVGDDARPASRSGEIARWPRSLIAIAHSAQETRSPVESSMSISRGSGCGEISNASAISRSVSLPRALRAPRRRGGPASRLATIRAAARLRRSASATDVPPNFMTTVPGHRAEDTRVTGAPSRRPAEHRACRA